MKLSAVAKLSMLTEPCTVLEVNLQVVRPMLTTITLNLWLTLQTFSRLNQAMSF